MVIKATGYVSSSSLKLNGELTLSSFGFSDKKTTEPYWKFCSVASEDIATQNLLTWHTLQKKHL